MSYRDDDDPFEEDIVFDQAGLLSTSRKTSKSAIRRVSTGKCAMFSKTLGLCGAFLGLGLTFAIPGPLSPVPPAELRNDKTLMTYEMMYRCQGFMIGAMFGARLLDRFNRLFLVFLALLVTALLVTIIPWCGIVWLLRTDMFLLGVSLGFLTTGGNVLCLDLWGRNSGPFMQALHFSFSLGVFLAPFLSQPLMAPINYSLVVPSTTPAMFPLHRLPRDVGNLSSVLGSEAPLLHSSNVHPVSYSNKSFSASTGLPTLLPTSSAFPKVGMKISTQDLNIPEVFNSTVSATTKLTPLQTSTVPTLPSHGVVSVNSSWVSNQTAISTTPSTTASTLLANASEQVIASVMNVLTTTHRAPRPKPVLVNSEKLHDKKWENEKFRKPPPEDLVPVSTTMKAMVRSGNNTAILANSSSSSSPVALLSAVNLTTASSGYPMSTEPTNIVSTAQGLNATSNSSMRTEPSSSSFPPSVISTMSTSTKGHVNQSTNFASVTNNYQTSSTLPPKNISKIEEGGFMHPMNSSPSVLTTLNVLLKSTSNPLEVNITNHSSVTPAFHGLEKMANKKMAKPVLTGAFNSSKHLENIFNNSSEKSVKESKKKDLSQHSKSDTRDKATHASEEILFPFVGDPKNKSHSIGKSITLDEQDDVISKLAVVTQSVKQIKPTIAPSLESHRFSSQPRQNVKPNRPVVTQHSFGESHVKVISEAKPTSAFMEEQDPVAVIKNNASQAKNSSAENPSNVEPPIGGKHRSKPASTVLNDTAEVSNTMMDAFANRLEKYGLSRMQLMYLTVGMVLLATSFLFLGFLCFNPRDPKSKTDEEEMNGPRSRTNSGQSGTLPSRCLRHTLIGLMLLLLMVTSGVQAMYGQLLMVYAIQPPLQLSESTGSALTATFWGALTSTRFACILLASALSPTAMLVLSVAICSCATWLLSAFASSSEVALWIGSVMVSVGTASVFPSGMLWMQRHVLITHRVAAMLVMGPAMGEMFFPTIAYKMMVSMGSASLIHLPALLSLFAIALWAATWRLARYPRQSLCSHVDESLGYQLANQHDEDDLLDLTMSPIVNGSSGAISRNSLRSTASAHSIHRMSA